MLHDEPTAGLETLRRGARMEGNVGAPVPVEFGAFRGKVLLARPGGLPPPSLRRLSASYLHHAARWMLLARSTLQVTAVP